MTDNIFVDILTELRAIREALHSAEAQRDMERIAAQPAYGAPRIWSDEPIVEGIGGGYTKFTDPPLPASPPLSLHTPKRRLSESPPGDDPPA
jgi:hypothetical protein